MMASEASWDRIPRWAAPSRVHSIFVPLAILVASLLLRLLYLWQDSASPFFVVGGVDTPNYLRRAAGLVAGTWPGPFAFHQPPLYPAWIAAIFQLLGPAVVSIKVAQSVLGSLSCLMVYFISKKSFGDFSVATLAAAICAFNGAFIYFDGQVVSVSLELFLQCASLLLLSRALEQDELGWWAAAGIAIGLSAINRGAILFCVPFVLIWILTRRDLGRAERGTSAAWGRRWAQVAAVALPILLCILPVSVHNFRNDLSRSVPNDVLVAAARTEKGPVLSRLANREFVLLTSRTGMNFHLGNTFEQRALNDPNHPMCLVHTNEVMKLPYRSVQAVSASAQQSFLMQLTLQTMAEEPMQWLQLMGEKVLQLLNGAEIPRNSNLYADRQYSSVLSALLWRNVIAFPSGLIIPLGLLGIYLDRKQWKKRALLLSFLVPRALFLLVFFVAARLRVPMLPMLSIFAAYAVFHLIRGLREGRGRALAAPLAAFACLLIASNAPIVPTVNTHGAYEHYILGSFIAEHGAFEAALPHFHDAVEVDPSSPTANFLLAKNLTNLRRHGESLEYLYQAVRLDPRFIEAIAMLGKNLKHEGRPREAAAEFHRILEIDPNNEAVRAMLRKMAAESEGPVP